MDWTRLPTMPQRSDWIAEHGPVRLSVSEANDGNGRWQWLSIMIGRRTDRAPEQCREFWPREAIALARQALIDLENHLNKGTNHDPVPPQPV